MSILNGLLNNLPKLVGNIFSKKNDSAGTPAATTAVGQAATPVAKPGFTQTDQFKSGVGSMVGDIGGLMSINSSSMNSASKDMARGDAAVDMVGSALSFIPGGGQIAGTALKLVNSLGSGLISKPKAFKDFSENSNIGASSSMGGIAAKASDMSSTIAAFDSSGIVGKLFGKKSKNINAANTAMKQQSAGQNVLTESAQALEGANTSADMFATRNNLNVMGYNTNGLRMGKEGMIIAKKDVVDIKKALRAKQGTKILRDTPKPKPLGLLNKEERGHWNGFSDYINAQGYGGSEDLNKGDLSKSLWSDYTSANNLDFDYDEFVPRAQNTISTFRGYSINKLKNGFGKHEGYDGKDQNYDWDNNYLPGLSNVDGWVGAKTTSFKFPKGAKVDLSKPAESTAEVKRTTMAQAFKEGGTIEKEHRNIIVDGALHAHKHTLKDLEEFKDADITHKGIPVITMSEGGEIEQHAEVEKDEIIFCLEVTEKLEALMADGSDEAKIEAGKLLTKELLFNTEDSSSELLSDD